MKKNDFKKQAKEILKEAEEKGLKQNFFFATTFERYKFQIEMMDELKDQIKELGPMVSKEYVKGRQNICINPAITEFNKTCTAANNTLATLINIIKNLPEESKQEGKLSQFLGDI